MTNFNHIIQEAEASGNVEIKRFCTFCIESADGDLMMDDGSGQMFPVPVCESCLAGIQKKYADKFDN